MKPIINPWWIYFAEVSEGIKVVSLIIFAVIAIIGIVAMPYNEYDYRFDSEEERKDFLSKKKRNIKIFFISLFVSLLLGIFCPFQKTIYKMIAASYITEDNLAKGKEEIKDLVDYITDSIDKIKSD